MLVALAAMGIGLVGIAIFPGNVAGWHPLFSLFAFVGGSAAAITSRKLLDPPASYVAVALGAIALIATVLGVDAFADMWPQTAIGIGGVERWIAYPVLLWMVLFGTALMGKTAPERDLPTEAHLRRIRAGTRGAACACAARRAQSSPACRARGSMESRVITANVSISGGL